MSTEVVKSSGGGLVLATGQQDYGSEAGLGNKGVNSKHFAAPFLNVAQDLSKMVKSRECEVGDFFISSNREIFSGKTGVTLVVCGGNRYYTEWKPNNGGFVGRHTVTSDVVENALKHSDDKFRLKNGMNSLMETFEIFALLVREDGSWTEVVMPFASKKIGPYKKELVTRVFNIPMRDADGKILPGRPLYPSFAHAVKITTWTDRVGSNDFSNVKIEYVNGNAENSRLDRNSALYKAAVEFAEAFDRGEVAAAEDKDSVPF